jgi:hypothetical protein
MKHPIDITLIARLSLSFVWLFTAATSFWWARDIGYEILAQQHIPDELADLCINAGSLLDAIIGFWLLSNYQLRWCYRIQILLILSYSLLISIIAPSFWLHPFGPVTKNIPILVLIFWLNHSNNSTK